MGNYRNLNDNTDKITEFNDKCIIIKIHDKYPSVYERVRRCWRNNLKNVKQADYVLAVIKGKVEGVFEPSQWYSVPMEECKNYDCDNKDKPCGRIEFIGKEADADIQNKYLSKYIPDYFMRPGPGPVQFTY
jgi:hypothetical protein